MPGTTPNATAAAAANDVVVDPCLFPAISSATGRGTGIISFAGPIQQEQLKAFSTHKGVNIHDAVASAWTLALREYTGAETAAFAFRDAASSQSRLVQVTTEAGKPIAHLVEGLSGTRQHERSHEIAVLPLAEAHYSSINTAVTYNSDNITFFEGLDDAVTSLPKYAVEIRLPEFELRYDGSLLSDNDAANVAQALEQALASVLGDGYDTVPVGDISLLGDEGRAQVQRWNSHRPDLWPVTIDQIVYQRVLEQPNAPAIQAPDGEYTYGQLNSAADRFSRYLLTLGVEPQTIVPFCFTKSAWAIISVLAILKAGATAAALDPSYPPERLQQILSQTGASLIVSSRSVREKIEQTASAQRVIATDEWFQANPEHPGLEDAPTGRSSADPSKAAFVVFTSGSTGNSKGIVLSHQSMCTSAFAHGAFMGLNPKSRVLQFAAYTFDVSNQDIWTTLMHGGCVCVPSDDERLNDIVGAINRMAVNWTFLTPTVARLLTPALVPTLRTLVLGGEAITQSNVDTWASGVRLLNSYGPAECSICCAVSELSNGSRLTGEQKQQIDPANIGWALPSAILWIANPQNHNVLSPIGAVGELLIEGPILAREYLHDPERTAAAFIESPAWAAGSVPPRRFYKTGDLVRYASDGTMRFVGRKDHQVKIRGQRTELGDIEHHLTTAPTVKQGSVFLPKKGHWADRLVSVVSLAELSGLPTRNGELQLVGSEHGKTVTEAVKTLHGVLSERLPSYMIPAAWFVVESIPLTPSAKVDRKKILHWIEGMDRDVRNDETSSLSAPTTNGHSHGNGKNREKPSEREDILQQIWARVLNIPVDRVDLHRSFISAGGDSISAMQVMGEARAQNLALSVQEILSAGSIVELAANARLVRPVDGDSLSSVASFSASTEEADIPFQLTPMQMQHFRLAPDGDSAFSQGFLLSLPHKVSVETLTDAIEALVSRHDMLRARFTRDATGSWKQHIASVDDDDTFELRSHRVKSLDKIDAAAQRARVGLDVTDGPVFSVDLFDVRGQGHQQLVYILAHQLVVDLVSWRVLLQELEEFLRRGEIGHPQPFPFSRWCSLQYEKAQILDPSTTLPWALEAPDIAFWGLAPTGYTYGSVVEENIRLSPDVSSLLLGHVPESLGVEPIDIFLASVAVSLAEIFPDHFVPTLFQEGHGRQPWDDAIDLSRTVGWFTTMAPIPFQQRDGSLSAETLAQKIHRSRKDIPDKGWADYTAKFLAPRNAVAEPAAHELLEMVFNYEGIYQILEREDSWIQHGPPLPSDGGKRDDARAFTLATSKAKFRSDFVSLLAVFEITAAVVSSQIEFSFLYPPGIQHRNRVSRWVERVQETLNAMARSAAGGSGELAVRTVTPLSASNYPFSHHAAEQADLLPEALIQIGVHDASLVEDVYRSSPMQEGLLLSQSSSNSRGGTYVLNYIWEFVPYASSFVHVDIERLSRAWNLVVQRHPALRTAFVSAPNGHIDQVVFRQREVHIERETIRDIRQQDLLSTASSLVDHDPLRPQYQLTLVETADGGQQFLKLAIHHTIFDGESAPVLASEIAAAYDEKLELWQPQPVPYVSLIKYLAERDGASALAYWKNQLSGAIPCHLPTLTEGAAGKDAEAGSVTDSPDRYELHAIKLDQSPATLQKACSRAGITLSTLFLTTWALVLRAYTGQESVSFGFLASGRDAPIPGIESVIGPVLNMLISHAVVKASSTPQEIAIGIQKSFVQSLSHQFTPLAEIHRELGQTKKSLFNTVLSYQRTLSQRRGSSQGTFDLERIGGQSKTEYGITLNVNVSEEDIRVIFKYWTSALSQTFAIRVADTFRAILNSIVQEFDTPLERIDLLSPSDSRDITAWGDGGRAEATKCIHTLVKQRAIESPDAVAIRSWDATLTYAELDAAASGLAYNLREKGNGIGPDVRVPILAPRSAWAVIGLLAVLKAGWAGFVVDPSASDEELEENLSYAEPHIILTTNELVDKAEKLGSFSHVVALDAASSIYHSDEPHGRLDVATLDSLCSIVFTSGLSEGRPRAVFLSHRSVASRVIAGNGGLGLTPSSSVLHHSPYTSHEGLVEVWSTLTSGSSLYIPEPSTNTSASLSKTIDELNVDWAILTPTAAGMLDPRSVPSLRTLVLAGEPFPIGFHEAWSEERQLIQSFSTAEVGTVSSTAGLSTVKDPSQIGRPLKNTRLWVADPRNHEVPVPIGAVGELLVEGAVSGLTEASARWVERPAWSTRLLQSNDHVPYRLYKTGDLVRYLPDGTLQYVSRVKDSGLGALERQLPNQTKVRQAVVVGVSEGLLKQQLVAVYTTFTTANEHPDSHSRDIVLDRLPEAQSSPSALRKLLDGYASDGLEAKLFIPIEAFPRLPAGKVDRRRVQQWLESLDASQYREILQLNQADPSSISARSDPTEDALAEIWSEVLHVPKETIGRETPFYNLGGDSISAIQAAARGRRLDLNLTVQDILQHRTIARIAPVVARRQPVVDVKTVEYEEAPNVPFGLAPIQALFFDADPDGKQRYYQSQYLELKKPVSRQDVAAALSAIVRRHPMLRARFTRDEDDDEWTQSISDDIDGSFMLGVVRDAQLDDITDSIKAAVNTIDLEAGPLVASRLFQYSSGRDILFIAVHHLVVDHVSWRIILKELEDHLLERPLDNEPAPYPFQQWSQSLTDYSSQHLRQPDDILPYDVPAADTAFWGLTGQDNTHGQIEQLTVVLNEDLASRLLTQSQARLRTEPVDVMLGALLHAFVEVFPDHGIPAIFNEGHGRDALSESCDISQTVGWFSTVAPLLSSTGESALDTIRRAKDVRQSLRNGGWPYFASRYLTPEGQAQFGHHYPMEIVFNYLGRYQGLEQDDTLFRRIPKPDVGCLYRNLSRFSLFEVLVSVSAGELQIQLSYPKASRHRDRLEGWMKQYVATLEDAVTSEEGALLSLADFPLLEATYSDLDRVANEVVPTIAGPVTISDIEDIYPSSPIQAGLLLSQARNTAYYEYFTFAEVLLPVGGFVDAGRLAQAWRDVVQRHAILRTVFVDSIFPQSIYDQAVVRGLPADIVPLQAGDEDPSAVLRSLPGLEFRPGQALHRLSICTTNAGAAFIRLDTNHAISDGASTGILLRDFAAVYHGRQIPPPPASQYRDFVSFLLQTPKEAQVSYWADRLAGIEPCLLPTSTQKQPVVSATELHFTQVKLPREIARIRTFCIQNGITVSTLLQTAWALVLRVYTNAEQVCFGYLVSGRDAPIEGIEDIVGPFLNLLVCRVPFDQASSPRKILQDLQGQFVAGLPHQFCPLADILHALELGGQTLFNTAFSFQRSSRSSSAESENHIQFRRQRARDPTEFDIAIDVEDSGQDVTIVLEHWFDKISPELASNIADTYTQAILSVLDKTDDHVRLLELAGPGSLSKIYGWNQEPAPSHELCIHHAFEGHARRQPDAPAVCSSSEGELSYAELDAAASILGSRLRAHGVGRNVLVPFMLSKSLYSVVGILAILKAGGAAVPLDPNAPQQRLETIASDTEAKVCLCSPGFEGRLSSLFTTVVPVSAASCSPDQDIPITLPEELSAPSDPAFVIFTSGSTGVPKGSILEHGSLSTSALSLKPRLNMHSKSRVLHFAAYTFDVSIEEVCFTLMHGACVCVVSEEERFDDLAGAMRKMEVTWAELTPTVVAMITPQTVPSLKTLVTGGETLTRSVISAWAGEVQLFNTYGPSECSVTCTATEALAADAHGAHIGSAVGSRAWVVDPTNHRLLVPVGAVGELVIEGRIVARGYLKNEAQTQARFLSSAPWLPEEQRELGTRLYRSGDLVRLDEDGTIHFIGRQDGQAKLHGQRLELGEIEHQISLHQSPEEQVAVDVLPVPGSASRKTLVAFLTTTSHGSHNEAGGPLLSITETLRNTLSQLKQRLALALPPYMIPSVYIPVHHLPRNTSGKTDRRALATLVRSLSEAQWLSFALAGTQKLPPTTQPQRQLQTLWSEVLGLDASLIGQDDHFFQLGGDSVFTIHLSAAARKAGLSLSAAQIFQHPTLRAMAEALQEKKTRNLPDSGSSSTSYVPFSLLAPATSLDELRSEIEPLRELGHKVEDLYPTTPLQQGLFALTLRDQSSYITRRTYQLPSTVDVVRFQSAWQQLVDETPILRTRIFFTPSKAAAYQAVLAKSEIPWFSSASLKQYLAADDARPIDEGQPLARYAIVREDNARVYFVWTAHHALYDGWSDSLVLKRLVDIYHGQQREQALVPFRSFVQHIRERDPGAADLFWTKYLAGTSTAPFPPRPAESSDPAQPRGVQTLEVTLPRQQGQHVTTATLLKTAWALVLSQYGDSTDVVFGLTLSGRDIDLSDIEIVAGPTVTTVPLRVAFDQQTPASEVLARVQSDAIEMIDSQHVGLQRIRALGDEAKAACNFHNLLVIQPGFSDNPLQTSLGLEEIDEAAPRAFTAYPFVLECSIASNSDAVHFRATHDVGAISAEQTRRVLHQLSTALRQLAAVSQGSKQTVGDLQLFSDYDAELVSSWNCQRPKTIDRRVTDLIRDQLLRGPEREAVRAWDGSLTYQELHDRAGVLARRLIQRGIGPGTPVGFSLPRSSWSPVVLLAIQLAGGVAVFIDSAYSQERIGHIINTTELKWFVATEVETCHFFTELGVTTIDARQAEQTRHDTPLPSYPTSNRAYIVFTSGSTGVPKGVAISHTALCSSITSHGKAMGLGPASRMLHYSAYTFDISLVEILTTLSLGGSICIPSEEDRLGNLASAIRKLEANVAIFTPTVSRLLNPDDVPSLKTIIVGGEAPQPQDLLRWHGHVDLMNMYGPAEAAMVASGRQPFAPGDEPRDIGRTLSGNNLWLARADDHNRLAAVGAVGELLIEGPTLAEGYVGDALKTADSFIHAPAWARNVNPHAVGAADRRFYKTGDLVRYMDDGSLFYVGRKDTQIKINGQRVEIGEIEHHIRECLPVPLGIVVDTLLSPDRGGRRELVVYFRPTRSGPQQDNSNRPGATPQLLLPSAGSEAMLLEVRDRLQVRLAAHMVPSLFVPVSFLPKTQNGKVDRKMLQSIGEGLSPQQRERYSVRHRADPRPPSTPAEAALQQLWSEVLGIPNKQIGADDSFIQLGGESLTAIQLVAAARNQHVSLSVQDVFRHPKLSDMALYTRMMGGETSEAKVNGNSGADVEASKPFSLVAEGSQLESLLVELKQTWHLDQDDVEDIYPTTPLQEGLLAATMKAKGTYVNREMYEVPENIDLDQFVSALELLIQRHAVLRTSIVTTTSWGSCQVVVRTSEAVTRVRVQDLQTHLQTASSGVVGQFGERLATASVVQDDAGRAYFLWTAHHSVYDGWMMGLLWKELEVLYDGAQPAVPRPFVSFVAHLQRQLNSPAVDEFWRRYLAEASPTVFPEPRSSLSTSHQPLASQSLSHTAYLVHELPTGSTISTVIRAAWAVLVSSYADDRTPDVVFNVTQSGRNVDVSGISEIFGPTITTYPVRVRWEDNATVSQFLADVQTNALDLVPYEHTGLQRISGLSADCKASCESNNLLVIHPANFAQTDRLGLRKLGSAGTGGDDDAAFLNYGLAVECTVDHGAVHVRASYDPDMIPSYQVKRLVHQLDSLIQQICGAEPDQLVPNLDRLSPTDQKELGDLHRKYPGQTVARSVPSVFAELVAEAPNAPAVDSQVGLRLTYAQLDRVTDILAHDLVSLGVRPDDRVAWCSGKSPWTVVGLIAIIKSGGTVIFLDPSHPPSRRRELLRASQPRVILAIPPHDSLFSADDDMPVPDAVVVPLDVNKLAIRELPKQSLIPAPSSIAPSNGLYVQFTSGSTGTPKGCVVEHGSFLSSATVYTKRTRLDRSARVYQLSSYSFDGSLLEILAALTAGACVCVPREEARYDDLAGSINDLRISWSVMTPSLARTLPVDGVPTLKDLMLAGEAVSPMDVARWSSRLSSSSIRLYNGYGPAECSILAHVNAITENAEIPADELGKPLASRSWIVEPNDTEKLVPLGAVGELLIDGPIVGRCYLNDPQRTAAAYIDPPQWLRDFNASNGDIGTGNRVYLTGDLVRYTSDGSISYVRRKDTQVKIRGQRAELGEIEHRLWADDKIDSAVVLYPKSGQCKDQLVGFLSFDTAAKTAETLSSAQKSGREAVALLPNDELLAASPNLRQVEASLSSQLPSYMIPTLWVPLVSIPLLVSGKANRRALLDWLASVDQETLSLLATLGLSQDQSPDGVKQDERPWTPVEETLRSIWCKVLGLSEARISLDSSFSRLGGNSISAMQVAGLARIAELHLPVSAMIRAKTLEELAASAKPISNSKAHPEARTVIGKAFPLSPMQQFYGQVALGDDELSRSTDTQFHYSFPFRLTSRVSLPHLDEALRRIVSRHPLLRARFRREHGQHVQEITEDVRGSYRLQAHQYLYVEDARSALEVSRTSLDIYSGPLVAADLVETATDQLLFLTIHHLVTDMVSWNVMLGELQNLLSSAQIIDDSDEDHHAARPYPFQSWVQRQTEIARTLDPAAVLPFTTPSADFDYWQMGKRPNLLQDLVGRHLEIDEARTTRLLSVGEGIDAQDVLIAALLRSFNVVFTDRAPPPVFRYNHGRDAPPGHEDIDLSSTVGWLTTISPLHVPVDAEDSLSAIVKRAEATRSSIPENGLLYFISRFLTAEGAAAFRHHERIEVLLNYLGSGLHGTTPTSDTSGADNAAGREHNDKRTRLEPFRAFSDSSEGGLGPRGKPVRRFALFGVQAHLREGRLVVEFEWNGKMGRQDQIVRWIEVLQSLLEDGSFDG